MLATDTVVGGRYRLGPIIGRGGGADVHRAVDEQTGNEVAVKVLRSTTDAHLRRFDVEAETLSRLDHPAIVRMCDRGEHEGDPYLVLDLVDGESLAQRLERGPLPEDEVRRIGAVLADALAHAHGIGIVHRDMKPSNVLFDQSDAVHLTDFGIARLTDMTAITSVGLVIGTAAYMAPEQVTGNRASPASDVFALGLVLLESLTGQRVFDGPPSEAAIARLHRAPEIPATIAPSLGALISSMTAMEPDMRPTAAAVNDVLVHEPPVDADATTVIPVATDATSVIPVIGADAVAGAHMAAGPSALDQLRERRGPLAVALVATLILVLFMVGYANGGGDLPATPPTTPSTHPTVVATSAPTTTPTTQAPQPPRGKRGKGNNNEGD